MLACPPGAPRGSPRSRECPLQRLTAPCARAPPPWVPPHHVTGQVGTRCPSRLHHGSRPPAAQSGAPHSPGTIRTRSYMSKASTESTLTPSPVPTVPRPGVTGEGTGREGLGSPVPCEGKRGWLAPARDRPAALTVFRTPPPASRRGDPEPRPGGWAAGILRPGSHGQAHGEQGLSTWPILIYSECAFN